MYSEETTDDGQRNCLKRVEFYSKNKFEKLVLLPGIIIIIFQDAQSPVHQSTSLHRHEFSVIGKKFTVKLGLSD